MNIIEYLKIKFGKPINNSQPVTISQPTEDNNSGLWKEALERYKAIDEVVNILWSSIRGDGIKEDGEIIVPRCTFCKKYYINNCDECGWSKIFGKCEDDNSKWLKIHYLIEELSINIEDIIDRIKEEINEIEDKEVN